MANPQDYLEQLAIEAGLLQQALDALIAQAGQEPWSPELAASNTALQVANAASPLDELAQLPATPAGVMSALPQVTTYLQMTRALRDVPTYQFMLNPSILAYQYAVQVRDNLRHTMTQIQAELALLGAPPSKPLDDLLAALMVIVGNDPAKNKVDPAAFSTFLVGAHTALSALTPRDVEGSEAKLNTFSKLLKDGAANLRIVPIDPNNQPARQQSITDTMTIFTRIEEVLADISTLLPRPLEFAFADL